MAKARRTQTRTVRQAHQTQTDRLDSSRQDTNCSQLNQNITSLLVNLASSSQRQAIKHQSKSTMMERLRTTVSPMLMTSSWVNVSKVLDHQWNIMKKWYGNFLEKPNSVSTGSEDLYTCAHMTLHTCWSTQARGDLPLAPFSSQRDGRHCDWSKMLTWTSAAGVASTTNELMTMRSLTLQVN